MPERHTYDCEYGEARFTNRKCRKSWLRDCRGDVRFAWVCGGILFGVLVLVIVISGLSLLVDRQACRDRAEIKGWDYQWSMWAGCVYASPLVEPDAEVVVTDG